ncbi:MAG: histidine phosphatase family protein [Candidatus Hodarchaeales archaeon]
MNRIYLIRHGQSEIHGCPWKTSCLPLSKLGIEQAKITSRWLAGINFSIIFSSPLRRALQTAEIIAEPHGLPVIQINGLREIDTGIFSDKTNKEVEEINSEYKSVIELARNGPLVAQILDYYPGLSFPGGESAGQMVKRVIDAWEGIIDRIVKDNHRFSVLISHAGTQTVILRHLISHTLTKDLKKQVFDNASISIVEITDGGNINISSLNSTDHLDSLQQIPLQD